MVNAGTSVFSSLGEPVFMSLDLIRSYVRWRETGSNLWSITEIVAGDGRVHCKDQEQSVERVTPARGTRPRRVKSLQSVPIHDNPVSAL